MKTPFDVTPYDSEDENQAALFRVLNMIARYGLAASKHRESYTERGYAEKMHAKFGLGLTEIQQQALLWAFAVPNGAEFKSSLTGAQMKAKGLTPGIPDIIVPFPSKEFPGLFVELKTLRGKLRPEQAKCITYLNSVGYCVRTAVGWREALKIILKYIGIQT